MVEMKVDIPDPIDGKVVSIEVARKRYFKGDGCKHLRILVSREEVFLTCRDCGEKVNPVEWIALRAEDWGFVRGLYQKYNEAKMAYEAKKRCRCDHCGKLTNVRPATHAEIREFKRGLKIDDRVDKF